MNAGRDVAEAVSGGSEFHAAIVLGKKKNDKIGMSEMKGIRAKWIGRMGRVATTRVQKINIYVS